MYLSLRHGYSSIGVCHFISLEICCGYRNCPLVIGWIISLVISKQQEDISPNKWLCKSVKRLTTILLMYSICLLSSSIICLKVKPLLKT